MNQFVTIDAKRKGENKHDYASRLQKPSPFRSCAIMSVLMMVFLAYSAAARSSDPTALLPAPPRRRLQLGGLGPGSTFELDETDLETEVLGVSLTLNLKNIVCSNVMIDTIRTRWGAVDAITSIAHFALIDFGVDCAMDYDYMYRAQPGSGSAVLNVRESRIEADLRFIENSSQGEKPDNVSADYQVEGVDMCMADIIVSDIAFTGNDPLQGILTSISGLLRSVIADQIEPEVCSVFSNADVEALGGVFAKDSPIGKVFAQLFWSDFLSLERSMTVKEDIQLINFQEPNSWIALVLSAALSQASSYLAPQQSPGEDVKDLMINDLIRDFAFDGPERQVSFDLSNSTNLVFEGNTTEFGVAVFQIDSVNVTGLDSVSSFDGLKILGSQTLQADLLFEYLNVTVGGELEIPDSGANDAIVSKERIEVNLALTHLNVSAGILLILDNREVGGIPIGSILNNDNATACLLKSIDNVQLAGIVLNEVEAKLPAASEMERLSEVGIEIDLARIPSELLGPFEADGDAATSTMANKNRTGATCHIPLPAKADVSYLDFRNLLLSPDDAIAYGADSTNVYGDLFVSAKEFLDDMFTPDSSGTDSLRVNQIIAPLLKDPIMVNQKVFSLDTRQDIRVKSIQFDHNDMIKAPSSVLEPVSGEPYVMASTLSLLPLQLTIVFEVGAHQSGSLWNNNIAIKVDFDWANLDATVFAKIIERRFFEFPIEDVFDMQCWFSTLALPSQSNDTSFWFPVLEAMLGDFRIRVGCDGCLDDENQSVTFSTSGPQEGSTLHSINSNIDKLLARLRGNDLTFESNVNRMILDAPKRCRHRPEYDPDERSGLFDVDSLTSFTGSGGGSNTSVLFIVLVTLVAFVALAAIGISVGQRLAASRRQRTSTKSPWLKVESTESSSRGQNYEAALEKIVHSQSTSMFKSKQVTKLVRQGVPFSILACSGLFLAGFFATSFTLSLRIKVIEEEFLSDDLGYSIARLTYEMWIGGGRAIAALAIICSAVLPQVLQFGKLFLFACPGTVISAPRRLVILEWLNAFGKWTMAVVFITIIACAAFRQTITSPIESVDGQPLYTVDMLVVPVQGFYFWGVAQILAQITGHVVVRCHHQFVSLSKHVDKDDREATEQSGASGQGAIPEGEHELGCYAAPESTKTETMDALCKESFSIAHHGGFEKLQVRAWVNAAVLVLGAAVAGLTVAGCIVPSISFDVGGALAATDSSEQIRELHSVVSIAQTLLEQARFLDEGKYYLGLGLISIIWTFVVLVAPIIHAIALGSQWFAPMRSQNHQLLHTMNLLLHTHQYLEVYIGSAIVSAWQLQTIAGFFLGQYCDSLLPIIGAFVNLGFLEPEDAECFSIQGSVQYGAFLLLGAAVLLAILRVFVSKAVEEKLNNDKVNDKVIPSQLHFAYQFRWFLRRSQA